MIKLDKKTSAFGVHDNKNADLLGNNQAVIRAFIRPILKLSFIFYFNCKLQVAICLL